MSAKENHIDSKGDKSRKPADSQGSSRATNEGYEGEGYQNPGEPRPYAGGQSAPFTEGGPFGRPQQAIPGTDDVASTPGGMRPKASTPRSGHQPDDDRPNRGT